MSLSLVRQKRLFLPLAGFLAAAGLFYGIQGTEQDTFRYIPLIYSQSATKAPSPSCPSIDGISQPLELLPQDGQLRCHAVESALHEFSVDACYHPDRCGAVDLVLKRTDERECTRMEGMPGTLNNDARMDSFMRNEVGPDTFFILTDGPERKAIWQPVSYSRGCEYSFAVRLANGGPFTVNMWWHYDSWQAWNESNFEWPFLHEMPVFKQPLEVDICPECPTRLALHQNEKTLVSAEGVNARQSDLPSCTSSSKRLGSYLPTPVYEYPAPRYRWQPQGCVWRHDGLRYTDHSSCLRPDRPHKFLFVGDSHARVTYDGIRHRMEGRRDLMLDSEKTGHKQATFPGLETQFTWDPVSEGAMNYGCDDIVGVTHVIISIGQHMQFFSTQEYYDRIHTTLRHLTTLNADCGFHPFQRKLFLPGPSEVPRNDTFPREFKDRANNIRLWNWAEQGIRIAEEEGWDWVNAFQYSSPFVRETLDMSHYYGTDALDAILDDVIGVMGFCDSR